MGRKKKVVPTFTEEDVKVLEGTVSDLTAQVNKLEKSNKSLKNKVVKVQEKADMYLEWYQQEEESWEGQYERAERAEKSLGVVLPKIYSEDMAEMLSELVKLREEKSVRDSTNSDE